MSSRREGNLVVFRFEDGKDVVESLKLVSEKHQILSGILLGGIGMLRDFEISFYSREKLSYLTDRMEEPVELLSLSGNISIRNDEIFFHLHASLAKGDKSVIGGHLKKGVVHNTLEGAILRLSETKLSRDPETGVLSIS